MVSQPVSREWKTGRSGDILSGQDMKKRISLLSASKSELPSQMDGFVLSSHAEDGMINMISRSLHQFCCVLAVGG